MQDATEHTPEKLSPFFMKLKKTHNVPKVTSYSSDELEYHPKLRQFAPHLAELQTYATSGNHEDYTKKLDFLKQQGLTCRQTKGKVYLTVNEGQMVDVEIAVQVKGNSLTWYFWAEGAMDQYPQEFRDRLYNQAAQCHKQVDSGCDLYYRGSNSYHLKNMHNAIAESGHNHNHYRLSNDQHYTPKEFNQHLNAFKSAPIHDEFFDANEIDELCQKFETFHADWIKKQGEERSKEERYFAQESQRYNAGDILEFRLFGKMQEPCRLRADELKVDYDAARKVIEDNLADKAPDEIAKAIEKLMSEYEALLSYRDTGGVRGGGSGRASARQPVDSGLAVEKEQVMDDKLALTIDELPLWANSIIKAANQGLEAIINRAKLRSSSSKEISADDPVLNWAIAQQQKNFKKVLVQLTSERGKDPLDTSLEDDRSNPLKKN